MRSLPATPLTDKGGITMKNNAYEAPVAVVIGLEVTDVITSSVFVDADVIPDGWLEV